MAGTLSFMTKKKRASTSATTTAARSKKPQATVAANDAVVSLRKALEILRAFRPSDSPLSRHEIAQRTGLPNTTAARLIHTLLTLGYLSRVGAHGGYRPGPSVLALGHAVTEALPFHRVALPLMQRFAQTYNVWVALGAAENGQIIIVEHAAPPQAPDIQIRTGSVLPLANTALGRAYLWTLPPARRAEHLRRFERSGQGDGAKMRPAFDAAMAQLDHSGYCNAFNCWRRDVLGIGTPIVMDAGHHALLLGCGNGNFTTSPKALAACGPALVRLATDIKNGLLQSGSLEDV